MLRTTLIAAALLLTPIAALASGDRHGYGDGYEDRHHPTSRVVVAQPRIAIAIGGAPFNGFNAYYQSGPRHVVAAPYYYAPVVVREPYYRGHRVQHRHAHRDWHDGRRNHRDRDRRYDNRRGWDD